mgnify:CR=1 FL=1
MRSNFIYDGSSFNDLIRHGGGIELISTNVPFDTMSIYYSDIRPRRRPCGHGWFPIKLQNEGYCATPGIGTKSISKAHRNCIKAHNDAVFRIQ